MMEEYILFAGPGRSMRQSAEIGETGVQRKGRNALYYLSFHRG